MNEDVAMSACADPDFLGNEPHAVSLQACNGGGQVRNFQAHVMQALAALGNKLGDGRVRGGALEQFEAALSYGNHYQSYLLVFDRLFRGESGAPLFFTLF